MLLNLIKDETLSLLTIWMDLEDIMSNEISQMKRDKNHIILFTCGI